jgi:Holliday junction resolvasome RuvABC endonuclease subunit
MKGMNGFLITMSFDLSTTCDGYAVWNDDKLVAYGKLKPTVDNLDWRDRIINFIPQIHNIMKQYRPQRVYVEDVPLVHNKSVLTCVQLGAVQGSMIGICASHNVNVEFIPVGTWRHKIGLATGNKEDMKRDNLKRLSIERANKLFNLSLEYKSPSSKLNDDDVADAILIGASKFDKYCAKYTKFGYLIE